MNHHSIIAAAVLATASLSTFAQEATSFEPAPASSLTREAVRAELRELQAAGAWKPTQEASVDTLQAVQNDVKIAALPENLQPQPVAQLEVPMDALNPLRGEDASMAAAPVYRSYTEEVPAGSAVTIEAVPLSDAAAPDIAQIFQHPAIATDGE